MYRISLDLNLLERPITARTKIVQVVSEHLAGQEKPHYGDVIRCVKQYLSGGSVTDLFEELSSLGNDYSLER